MSAATRASYHLRGTTVLSPQDIKVVIENVAASTRGGGASLLTTGLVNLGAQVQIEQEEPSALRMSLSSGKRLVELCTFDATWGAQGDRIEFKVGGLKRYKTTQQKLWYMIPVGPKQIHGMAPYKRFINGLRDELQKRDPSAQLVVE